MHKIIVLIVILINVCMSKAQEISSESDLFILTEDIFFDLIINNHPVIKQADLILDNAEAELSKSRGGFDPKISAEWDLKDYNNTEYYDKIYSELKIPIWFPIDPKITFNRNNGQYLNPENYISSLDDFNQITAGISLPLGRGLFIDSRRAVLNQAKIYQNISQAERIKLINKILFEATKDYWSWYNSYNELGILNDALTIAKEIYSRTLINFEFGEASALDTIQASIIYQTRKADVRQARTNYINSILQLSNYLWDNQEMPMIIQDNVKPEDKTILSILPTIEDLNQLKESAINNHPEIRKLSFKLDQLDIERRLNAENMKPQIDLNYNLINEPINPELEIISPAFENVKFGLNFSFPLFLRKERAELVKTKIKIDDTNYELILKKREISNSVETAINDLINAKEIIEILNITVSNYKNLLEGELLNLENGESDLFKINIQQEKYLEAQIKLLKEQANFEKAKGYLYWSAGVPFINLKNEN